MLTDKQGKRMDEYVPDYVLFDLETTGISVTMDEVIEISAVKVAGRKVTEEFTSLVNPQRAIPYAASMVNGITDEMVTDKVFEEMNFVIDDSFCKFNSIHNSSEKLKIPELCNRFKYKIEQT